MNPWEQDWSGAAPQANDKAPWERDWGKPSDVVKERGSLEKAKDYALTGLSEAGKGAMQTVAGLADTASAPVAKTRAMMAGGAALVDRFVSDKFGGAPNQTLQEFAQDEAATAEATAQANATNNVAARASMAMRDAARDRVGMLKEFDKEFNPELVRQQQAMSKAEGFVGNVKAMADNPMAFMGNLANAAPAMAMGAGLGSATARGLGTVGKVAGMTDDAAAALALRGATAVGVASEASSSGAGAREGIRANIMTTPHAQLAENSPRYQELMKQSGMTPTLARETVANEVSTSASLLASSATALGSMLTNKLFGNIEAKMVAGQAVTAKQALQVPFKESAEEVAQGMGEDYAQHRAMLQADKTNTYDPGGSLAQNAAAGFAMSAPGAAGGYAHQRINVGRGLNPDGTQPSVSKQSPAAAPAGQPQATPPAPAKAPAPAAGQPAAARNVPGARAAAPVAAAGVAPGQFDYAAYDQYRTTLESGGSATAKNPESSATGLHQFTEGTWLATVAKAKPAWADGLSREQILAARTDPAKSTAMVKVLDNENAQRLTGAGQAVNAHTMYAAHHFGAGRAIDFAKASPDTPMNKILSPAQIRANSYLDGMTKAQAIANWDNRASKGGASVPAPSATNNVATGADPTDAFAKTSDISTEETDGAAEALKPREASAVDKVAELDQRAQEVERRWNDLNAPEYGPTFDAERADLQNQLAELRAERDQIARDWPKTEYGHQTSFTTEAGVRLDGRYAIVDADALVTSHNSLLSKNAAYPQELQPRERDRAASEAQISGIVNRLDPARLGVSADAATGAPIIGADGVVESGNARTIALMRAYEANGQKAADYRQFLTENAGQFGLSPEQVAAVGRPVLVRVRNTPVDRAEFARQANASTVAAMSPSEQARSDAQRIDSMEDLTPNDDGDFATSRDFIRRFMARLPMTEQAGMVDSSGALSTQGYSRVRNAVLAKAYGDSPVLQRLTESMDDNLRNVSKALVMAAPEVAKMRSAIDAGARFDVDIAPDLLAAVTELSRLKDDGTSVADAIAQVGMFGEYSPEVRDLLQFLADNIRRPRRIADFVKAYYAALDGAGDPNQGSLLGDTEAPEKGDLMKAARQEAQGELNDGDTATQSRPAATAESNPSRAQAGNEGRVQRADEARRGQGDQVDGPARSEAAVDKQGAPTGEWRAFPPDMGSLGIPRAEMPQIKAEHRGAFIQFLKGRGIEASEKHEVDAAKLKPTQAEFSMAKVEGFIKRGFDTDRSVLVSSDGYVLDGHHQWMAHAATNQDIPVIELGAPMRDLLAAAYEFPSVQRSEGAAVVDLQERRAEAVRGFKDAMAELADMATQWQRAAFRPQDKAKLMPVLAKLFDQAVIIVGVDARRVMKWVQAQLRANPATRGLVNKIDPAMYREAAEQAAARMGQAPGQVGLFDSDEAASAAVQGDLFAAPAAEPVQRQAARRITGFGELPDLANFVPSNVRAAVQRLLDEHYKAAAEIKIDPKDQADAEAALAPFMAMAREAQGDFDAAVKRLGERFGVGHILPPGLKKIGRAAEKLVADGRSSDGSYDGASIKDLLRATVLASSHADGVSVLDAIYAEFDVMRVKNRTDLELSPGKYKGLKNEGRNQDGYGDFMVNVRLKNGLVAEIQVNTPEMVAAKEGGGHKLFEVARTSSVPADVRNAASEAMRALYAAAFLAFQAADLRNRASFDESPVDGRMAINFKSPESSNRNQRPSGNPTYSSPPNDSSKTQPGGNLSGTFMASPDASIVGDRGGKSDSGNAVSQQSQAQNRAARDNTQNDLFGAPNADPQGNRPPGDEGAGTGAVPSTGAQRQAGEPRAGADGRAQRGNSRRGDAANDQARHAGAARPGAAEAGGGTGSTGNRAGNRVAGVPVGREIPVKSGRNYGFTGPDDLTYAGSWAKKAEANVAAVELLQKLIADQRQATPAEQAVLAKFVGWGASELANNLFNDKRAAQTENSVRNYEAAVRAIEKAGGKIDTYSGGYGPDGYSTAYNGLPRDERGVPTNGVRYGQTITVDMLQKPDTADVRWLELRNRLKAAMTDAQWKEAARTTQYGHYTSKAVVQAMWGAMQRMGFKGGAVLEPGAGIGVFPGLMPADMAVNSTYTGIEYDTFTGNVLKQLMPDERIVIDGYQNVTLPKDFYDVAIGNPPFSATSVLSDSEYKRNAFKLHDYFFAKTIDRVKPGGLLAFVTSRYTMDKLDDKARAYLAERADLIGAIRMPQTAFKQNAGTEVVTDVLFLRKKVPGETFAHAQPWAKSLPMKVEGETYPVNEYFHAHPEMVLGSHSSRGSMRAANEYTVLPGEVDIDAAFAKAAANLPADVYRAEIGSAAQAAQVREIDFNPTVKKEGNFYVTDKGVLMQREGGQGLRVEGMKPADEAIVKAYVPLRDAVKQAQYDQLNGGPWEQSLAALQKAYKTFTDKHGPLLQAKPYTVTTTETDPDTGEAIKVKETRYRFPVANLLRSDPDGYLTLALERFNEETGRVETTDALTKRVLEAPAHANIETAHDALLTSLNDLGRVDIPTVAKAIGMSEKDAIEALGTAIYQNPSDGWQMADEYLSGNVKKKLAEARAAAQSDARYERNVTALEAVQPAPKTPAEINIGLGMNWVPAEFYEQFLKDLAGTTVKVNFNATTRDWSVQKVSGYATPQAMADWGTQDRDIADLLVHALKGTPIDISRTENVGGAKKTTKDHAATEAANEKLKALRERFSTWVWENPARSDKLVQIYNDKFNTTVPRRFDGRHLKLPGTTSTITVFDHVKRGAWRIIQSGNTYLAHAVGSGKAQPLDAKVLTPTGWRLMGELAPGDMVIAGDGTPTMVEAVFPQGVKEIFRVEFSDGAATECCDEHLWLTQTYRERSADQRARKLGKEWPSGKGRVRSLAEIRASLVAPRLGAKNHSIPMVAPVQFGARSVQLDPYVMGALIGDGGMTNGVVLSSVDEEILEAVASKLPADCELVHRGGCDYQVSFRGQMQYAAGGGMLPSNPVKNALRSYGLHGKSSHEKFIPSDYLFNTVECRVALLRGLMDTDGTVEGAGTSCRFTTVSRQLANDVKSLVQSLGGIARERLKQPTFTYNGVRKIGRTSYELCISTPPWLNPFSLSRKAEKVVAKSKYVPARYITAVVSVGSKPAQCIRVSHPSHLYVTDDFVVTHNTWQMVISAMEQKRLGLIKKPMFVVPNHMLQQFASEWMQLYPAARLMVADEENFHTDNRRRFVSRVALSDLDGVIITQSAFKILDLDHKYKAKIIQEQIDQLEAALHDADPALKPGQKSRDPTVKQIQAKIEKLETKLQAAMSSDGKDKNVMFDELGVDMLYVDEAHGYRKLDYATSRKVKGLSSDGSAMALDLYAKVRYLAEKNPKRNLVMASGTPITNTIAELYSLQRFMAPEGLEDRGLTDFDSWAAQYGRETTSLEAGADGKYSPVTRFQRFVNVGDLTMAFRQFADVLTSDDLAAILGDKRPKVNTGSRQLVLTPKTEGYREYQLVLADRTEKSRKWRPSRDEPNNPDPIIAIIGDGRLAAIDTRFVVPGAPNDPQSKLNQMIDRLIERYQETADNTYVDKKTGQTEPIKGGTMMVFSDIGFGEGVRKNRGFDTRAWVNKRLADAGVDLKQVAYMSDYKGSAEKLKLFRDVNAGKVRILIGTSKNMGTGVNAQQRLTTIFHLDPTWYPADIEQREGRAVRQGNKNPSVDLYALATKGTYDQNMWQMIARKAAFIDQIMTGDGSINEVEDVDSESNYAVLAAMVADDPRLLELAGAESEVKRLERLYQAHETQRQSFIDRYNQAELALKGAEKTLPAAEAAAKKVPDLSGDNFKAKVGGATITERVKFGEALIAQLNELSGRVVTEPATVGEIGGFPLVFHGSKVGNFFSAWIELETADPVNLVSNPGESPAGIAMRAQNAVASIARYPDKLRERIAEQKAVMDSIKDRRTAPFPMAQVLVDARAQVESLKAILAAEGDAAATKPAEDAPKLSRRADDALSPADGAGVALRDVRAMADRVAKALPNMPGVEVLQSTREAPAALRAYLEQQGAMDDTEGAFHDGSIYLFADNLSGLDRAEHVLATHEAGHAGLAAILGADRARVMQSLLNQNDALARRAAAVAERLGVPETTAIEELLVDVAPADLVNLKGWRRVAHKVQQWLARSGFNTLADRMGRWLDGRLSDQQRADMLAAKLMTAARDYLAGREPAVRSIAVDAQQQVKWLNKQAAARGYDSVDALAMADFDAFEGLAAQWRGMNPAAAMKGGALVSPALSRTAPATTVAQPQQTPAQRADALIQQSARTAQPLDAVARAITRATGIEWATRKAGSAIAGAINRYTPEVVKAGLVSDYGLDQRVRDERVLMQARQQVQLRKAGQMIDSLASLTREESAVAYRWMNETDPQAIIRGMSELPEGSVEKLQEVQRVIDKLSQEAVDLGQLDQRSYERNKFAYLHRSYAKHVLEPKGAKAARARTIAILGNQYKGRGTTENIPMAKVRQVAPDWWDVARKAGKADPDLVGKKLTRYDRLAPTGAGTQALPGMDGRGDGRVLETVYLPADRLAPAKYAEWRKGETYEVRDTKGGDLVLWRDWSAAEREKMGEIDEARFAIAKTLHGMIRDVEVGRFLRWLARTQAKPTEAQLPAGATIVDASESLLRAFVPGEWVKVPESNIAGTGVKKYGELAGKYVEGPVWNEVRQALHTPQGFGKVYGAILNAWKLSKTALSPTVHMNNIMSNAVMADWHDVTAGHVAKALRIIMGAYDPSSVEGVIGAAGKAAKTVGMSDQDAAREVMKRYQDSGAELGSFVVNEAMKSQVEPLLTAMEAELKADPSSTAAQVGVMSALQLLRQGEVGAAAKAAAGAQGARQVIREGKNMIDLYQSEDAVFRLASWLKAKEEGKSDIEAGRVARRSFMDYNINAPWIQAARRTVLPFIAYTYRAAPMMADIAVNKPHKLMKLMAVAGAINALGSLLAGGADDDKIRKLLPKEKAGGVWGLVPKLIRMPWHDANGSPVFLDIRRWIPMGDVFDIGQGNSAVPIPPSLMPGGPLALAGELIANKSQFTGKPIVLETDTAGQKAGKVLDFVYKWAAPNVLGLPGSYATTGVMDAAKGRTDAFGRERSVSQAIASSVGLKLASYPRDILERNIILEAKGQQAELERGMRQLARQRATRAISPDEFDKAMAVEQGKLTKLRQETQEKLQAGR